MPIWLRSARRGIEAMSTPSRVIRPPCHLVEAHHQVDQRGLAGPGGPDDRDGLPRLGDEGELLDERGLRVVGERHVLEADLAETSS